MHIVFRLAIYLLTSHYDTSQAIAESENPHATAWDQIRVLGVRCTNPTSAQLTPQISLDLAGEGEGMSYSVFVFVSVNRWLHSTMSS